MVARSLGSALLVAGVAVTALLGAGAAAAQEGSSQPATSRCEVSDDRLAELSGLAVDGDAVWAMGDGGRRVAIYRIDPRTCGVLGSRTAAVDPYDAEDLAMAPDGTMWVADTGDNRLARDTVAVVALPRTGPPRLYRLSYGDGPHDAEALLVGTDGVPVIVTKEAVAAAGVYVPEGPLSSPGPTPLLRVGEVSLPQSNTPGGPLGAYGSRLVTGAALGAGGRVAALRSYTDAWLYPVAPAADSAALVAALREAPVQVPLPEEPQGEAIAFDPSGALLSAGETRGGVPGALRVVEGAVAAVHTAPAAQPAPDPAAAVPAEERRAWSPALVGAVAVAALLALGALLTLVRGRARRRRQAARRRGGRAAVGAGRR